jgi:acetyl-CoA carboxylase carboxyltransferase component
MVNQPEAVADRGLSESSKPRLHIAGRSDADPASAEAESEGRPHRRTSLYDTSAALRARKNLAKSGEGEGTRRQRELGKMGARERVDALLDDGSFVEIGLLARHRAAGFGLERSRPDTDGVVTGWGTVDGRKVFIYAHDFRIFGGSLGEVFATKIHTVMDLAAATGAPVIGLNDGGGARIQEGITALAGFGGIFARNVSLSGVVPQISVILGPCAGGAAYSPALTDFVFSVKDKTNLFITGPDVVEAVTGEKTTREELGGAVTHATRTGVASFLADDESSCFDDVRYLLSFLPSNNQEDPPYFAPTDQPSRRCDELLDIVPAEPHRSYDVRDVIEVIVDDQDYLEVQPLWATNIVCAFARLDGHVVGIVANQPQVLAGALNIDAAEKAARFVRTCDSFSIPLVTLVDVPGFLPGIDQEHAGIIRRGAKLLYAYCEATVPRIQVVLRKAYGGAYIVMDSKSLGADLSFAWPSNEIAVMGADGAASIIFRKEIAAAPDPVQRRKELVADYTQQLMTPYVAAERGMVDDVIEPGQTRMILIRSLEMLRSKRASSPHRKHGNMPL